MKAENAPNFKIIQFIYASLILGILVALYFTADLNNINIDIDISTFKYMLPALFVVVVLLSNFLFKKTMSSIKRTDSLFEKLTKYQSANLMRGAPLEGFSFFAIFSQSNTSNYLIFIGLAIVVMLINFPSKSKFENLVNLNMEEQARLKDM